MSDFDNDTNLSESEIDARIGNSFTNLKILGKLRSNNKLSYTNNKFSIDEWNYSQPLRRWWSHESRSNTLEHLENFVENLFETIDLIYSKEVNEDIDDDYYQETSNMVFKDENSKILLRFVNEISGAIKGLNNLKRTYKNDTSTVSSLEIIIEKLDVRSRKIAGVLTLVKQQD